MDYGEAIEVLERSNEKFEFSIHWGVDLQSEHERYLTEKYAKKPVIVINYPKAIKAFMRLNDDGCRLTAREPLLALTAADDLADPRRQYVHRRDGAAVVVEPHIEGFDGLRVVHHDDRLLRVFLGQIASCSACGSIRVVSPQVRKCQY